MSKLNEKLDNEAALFDITAPGKANERRSVESSAITFSSSLVAGPLYEIANESSGSVAYFRIDGANPAIAYGFGDSFNGGIPVMPYEKYLFRLTGSATHSLKVIVSGSANITLYSHD